MKQSKNTFKNLLQRFFKFHKREVKEFNAILGIKSGRSPSKY
jgi:hypothetical protein